MVPIAHNGKRACWPWDLRTCGLYDQRCNGRPFAPVIEYVKTFFPSLQRIAASIALAVSVPALVLLPVTASAATMQTNRTVVYSTSLQPVNQDLAYAVTGSLHIKTSADGIVSGFYRSDDNISQFIPVSGGINGSSVLLLIGSFHPTRVTGTYENGTITGTAITPGNGIFKFAATNAQLDTP